MEHSSIRLVAGCIWVAALGFGWLAWHGHRRLDETLGRASFTAFAALLASTALVGGATLLLEASGGAGRSAGLDHAYNVLLYSSTIPWFAFAVAFTGRSEAVTRRRTCLLAAPVAAAALSVIGRHWLALGPSVVTVLRIVETLTWALLVGLFVTGAALLAHTARAYEHLSVELAIALSASWFVPFVATISGSVVWVEVGLLYGFAIVAVGSLGGCLALAVGVYRYDPFDSTAVAAGAAARDTALSELDDAIFVVDDRRRVVELNESARLTFGLSEPDALGRKFAAVVGSPVETLRSVETTPLSTPEGARRFDPQVSELTDQRGRHLGAVVSLRDVTERVLREQRIQILHRILRHNLRNRLSIVRGNAEILADRVEGYDELTHPIREATDELLELGERARDVERLLHDHRTTSTDAPVGVVVESVVSELGRDHPDVTFETSVPSDAVVSASLDVLRYVVVQIVENAAKHNDADEPRVTIWCRPSEERVRLRVADNGPGIPDHERAVIDEGEESPLEHGSGLGLWAAYWGVTGIGGELRISENHPRGTVVELDLPAARRPEDADAAEA